MEKNIKKLKAGLYRIADPYYLLDNFRDICEKQITPQIDDHPSRTAFEFEVDGHKCVALQTELGDGCYPSSEVKSFWVDSGMIAIVPEELMIKQRKVSLGAEEYRIKSYAEDFRVFTKDGVLHFGDLKIFTAGVDYEDDYDF